MAKNGTRRQFGQLTKLPSGRYRARYSDPDGRRTDKGEPVRYNAPATFETIEDAQAWLTDEKRLIDRWQRGESEWTPPAERLEARRRRPLTFGEYAPGWLRTRKVRGRKLADRTRDHYQSLLDRYIYPTFEGMALKAITPDNVMRWYDTEFVGIATTQAHAYGLLRSILRSAADPAQNSGNALIPFNPCGIVGGGSSPTTKRPRLATAAEVATLVEAMPERHRLMVLLADGCGLRYGELTELRRQDIDTKRALLRIRRGVVRSKSAGVVAKAPKSDAGIRDVPIPPHLLPTVREHLLRHTEPGPAGLLFPGRDGQHLAPSAFYGRAAKQRRGKPPTQGWGWYEARRQAGRPDLRFHDLRHGALTEAARHGATLAELMALGGHSTSQAALRYQGAASERLTELARKRSEALGWKKEDSR